jgi:hypothetical protein
VAPRTDIDNLLLVLNFRHYFFLGLEVRVMAGRADRVAARVFFVFLVMVTQLVLFGDISMASVTNNLHSQLTMSIMRAVAFFAGWYLFRLPISKHFVEILHVDEAFFAVAFLTVDGPVSIEVREILKIGAALLVAVETLQFSMDRAVQYRFIGVNTPAVLSF